MRLPTVDRSPSRRGRGTANERFRAGDRGRLHRCLTLSAAAHLLLVLAWPELTLPSLEAGRPAGAAPLELVALGPAAPPGAGLVAVPLTTEEEPEDASRPEAADGQEREGPGDGAARGGRGGSDRRAEALGRLAAVTPGLLARRPDRPTGPMPERREPIPEAPVAGERPDAGEREGDAARIPGASSDVHGRLSEEELLRLERVSSVRPGLAFGSATDWLVVQNPRAVSEFMRRRFPGASETGARGSLSVSLWVDERGSVEWAEIHRSSGRADVDESALELFEEVIAFAPAREMRRAVPTAAIFWLTW